MSNQADAARLIDALVSRRCGLVTDLTPQARGPDEPCPPHLWNGTLAHYNAQSSTLAMRLTGGKGRTEAEAQLAALGEAIERYCAFGWDHNRMRIGPASETAITPPDCVLYSDQQYAEGRPYQQWSPDVATTWIIGTELSSGAAVEIPASLVYLLGPPPRIEDHFTVASSNGLAAGKDLTHAILGGLNEVIERDAFMITWLNRLPATLIKNPEGGCTTAQIIRHYAKFGTTVRLLSLPTDQAPYVVMAIAENPSQKGVSRIVGLGCDIDPVAAVDKATFEMCQLRPGMAARMQASDYQTRLTRYDTVRGLDDHPLFHTLPAHAAEFDFLTQTKTECDLRDLPRPNCATAQAALDLTVAAAASTGARVAYVDITTPDIVPLGPRVVRVIATGLQPIHFGHGQGRFGGTRLFDAPVNWGLRDTPLTETGLNQCPHPLA